MIEERHKQMQDYLLSIIVPIYNVEKYLDECISSIITPLMNQYEIILVDDGSQDSSGNMCDFYKNKYDNIQVVHKKNGGLSSARNAGITIARGQYLLFLDSDDKLSEGSLSIIIDEISSKKVDILMGRAMTFDEDNSECNTCNIETYMPYMAINDPNKLMLKLDKNPDFWFAAWLIVIRKSFLLENELFFKEGLMHEDELWVPLVFVNAKSVCLIDYCFYFYRVNRKGSIVSTPQIKREFDKLKIAKTLHKYKCTSLSGSIFLKRRSAALVFGIILSLRKFKNDKRYNELISAVRKSIYLMMFGKYIPFSLFSFVFGPKTTSKLLSFIDN